MASAALEAEIACFTATRLLTAYDHYASSFGPSFISGLDELLLAFNERSTSSSTFNNSDVIEIQGAPASSKTYLLYFLAMTTLLPYSCTLPISVRGSSNPPRMERIDLGGRDRSVVLLDTDNKFRVETLEHMLAAHIFKRASAHCNTVPALYGGNPSEDSSKSEVRRALSHLHIFKPTSTISLAATIKSLPHYFSQQSFEDERVAMLVIDSMSAFYQQDRFASELKTAPHSMHYVMTALAEAREQMGCLIIMTNWALINIAPDRNGRPSQFFKQHLAFPYPNPYGDSSLEIPFDPFNPFKKPRNLPLNLTHQITLRTEPSTPYAPTTVLKQAVWDSTKDQNKATVKAIQAFLRLPGHPGNAGSSSGVGSFAYRISNGMLEA